MIEPRASAPLRRAAHFAAARALLLAGIAGCAHPDRAPEPRDSAVVAPASALPDTMAPPAFQLDTTVNGYDEPDTLRLDGLRVEMARVEQLLARAPEREQPRLLLELGRTKRLYIAPAEGRHGAYARGRPDEYTYDEVGGRFVYRGKQLRDLIERFPRHPLADDAAWQLTLLPSAGECEGFVVCYIEYRWRMVRDFLDAYPGSPYAPRALDRAIAAFDDNLKDVRDLTVSTETYDAADLTPLVADFDSVTARLPSPLRERAAAYGARLHGRMRQR